MARRIIMGTALALLLVAVLVAALPGRFFDAGELLDGIATGPPASETVDRRLVTYDGSGRDRRADRRPPGERTD